MLIDNPFLKDIDLNSESAFIFQKVKSSDTLNGKKAKEFMSLKFKDVEFVKQTIQNPNEIDIAKCLKIVFGFKDYNNLRLFEFYKAYNYIIEQVKIILNSEKNLHSEPSQRLINAGIERFSIFGALNVLDDIGQRYSIAPHDVEKWTYGLIFSISLKMKYEADIQRYLETNEY